MLCFASWCARTGLFPDVTEMEDKVMWAPDALQLQKEKAPIHGARL